MACEKVANPTFQLSKMATIPRQTANVADAMLERQSGMKGVYLK
jgi:hypothetical protein